MPILLHQNAKRAFGQAEFDRTIADEFAVEFDRDGLVAFHPQSPGLEIFDLGHTNVGTKHDILQIFDDLKIAKALEYDHVQKTVIDHGMLKKGKRPAVQSTIAHQDERSFVDCGILRLNEEPGRL